MKRILTLLIITLIANAAIAQMKPKEIEAIKRDTTKYYGISKVLKSSDKAIENAKDELYANIAKNCKSDAIYLPNNGDNQVETIIRTFKDKIQGKAKVKVIVENEKDDEYQYITYLQKDEFRQMCAERQNTIFNYLNKAYKMEDAASLEDALKSYYWALMLWYAHPQGNALRFDIVNEKNKPIEKNLDYLWVIERINGSDGILKSFNFIVPKEDGIEENEKGMLVKLNVIKKVGGKKVASLRCDCYDGQRYMPNTVRDGNLVIQIYDKEMKKLKIKVNYEFKEDTKMISSDVLNALELIQVPRFANVFTVDLEKTKKVKKEEEVSDWKDIDKRRAVNDNEYLRKMSLIENALRSGHYADARECFSVEGYNMLDTLSHYGKMTVVGKPEYKFLKYNDEVLCRSILMQFDFRNTVGFTQEVVFRFDTINKVVTSLAFRLTDLAEHDIISKDKWPEDSKLILINFLEDYQTAYALKRHRFLESIYSDDALIIVGRVIKRTKKTDQISFNFTEQEAELKEYDKNTYMDHLRMCFDNNEYIRLRFTETEFTRASERPNTYGVRVRQEYYSSSYGDVGYLFLLVDLNGPQPIIHVRAWQPDKVDIDKLVNMSDVRFN